MKKLALSILAASTVFSMQNSQASCEYAFSNGGVTANSRCPSGMDGDQYGQETGSLFSSKFRNGYILRDSILTRNGQKFALRLTGSDDPETGFCKILLVSQDENGDDGRIIYQATENLGVGGKKECHLKMNFDTWGYGDDEERYSINYQPLYAEIKIEAENWEELARDDSHPDYFDILQSPSAGGDDEPSDAPVDAPETPIDSEDPDEGDSGDVDEEDPIDDIGDIDANAPLNEQFGNLTLRLEEKLFNLSAKGWEEDRFARRLENVRKRFITRATEMADDAIASGSEPNAQLMLDNTLQMIDQICDSYR